MIKTFLLLLFTIFSLLHSQTETQTGDIQTREIAPVEPPRKEIKEQTPSKDTKETLQLENFKLSLDGIFFPRYEFKDRTPVGRDDLTGSSEETTGFGLARTYLNLRGKIDEGKYKGMHFRLTSDLMPHGRMGDGCTADMCERSNPYTLYLKYAFVNIPVFGRQDLHIRIGQQHDPTVNSQSIYSLQDDAWGHRYVARTTWEDIGLTNSTDRGISLIFNSDYFGFHTLLGNGEGPFRNNGERILSSFRDPNRTVAELSQGVNDSYGLGSSTLITIIPTGKNKTHKLALNVPIRLENVTGISSNETQFLAVDICGSQVPLPPFAVINTFNAPNTVCEYSQNGVPNYSFYKGTKRAKQDIAYGSEVDYSFTSTRFKFTIGAGTVIKIDRRDEAIRLSRSLLQGGSVDLASLPTFYRNDTDQVGNANYILAHLRFADYGVFGRYTKGTAGAVLGQLGTRSSQPWINQVVIQDFANNILGDFSLADAGRIDLGKATFTSKVLGVTYYYSPEFQVSLGFTEVKASDGIGRPLKENVLERIPALPGSSATGRNLSEQLESPQVFYSNVSTFNSLGYNLPGQFATNEWIGKSVVDRQVFIRAQFVFGTVERLAERN